MHAKRILIVEDEAIVGWDLADSLQSLGFEIAGTCMTAEEAVESARTSPPDLVLMDITLAGEMDGIQAAAEIQSQSDVPIVYITAYDEADVYARAKETLPYGYLRKPIDTLSLKYAVETALHKHEADKRVRESESRYRFLFEHNPVALWDEDCSGVRDYVQRLRESGVTDFRRYLQDNPDEVWRCVSLVKIRDVNRRCLSLYGVNDKEELLSNLEDVLCEQAFEALLEGIVTIAEGRTEFEMETVNRTGTGETRAILLGWSVVPGYERTYERVIVSVIDITDQKKVEEALLRNREMLALTGRIANVGSWEWDIETDRVTWSDELFRIFGREPAENAPSFAEHPELYPPEDMQRLRKAVEAAVNHGTPYEMELRAVRDDGATRICLARGEARRNEEGKITQLVGSFQDITDRKKAEEALRESEERFRAIFENASVGIDMTDREGRLVLANSTLLKMLGYSQDEILGKTFADLTHPDDRDRSVEHYQNLLAGRPDSYRLEKRYLRKDGSVVWGDLSVSVVRNNRGTYVGTLAVIADITARKTAEEVRREIEERYRILAEDALMGVYIHQSDYFVYANRRLLDLLGYSRNEFKAVRFWEIFVPDLRDQIRERGRARYQGRVEPGFYESRIMTKDGDIKWVEVSATAFDYRGGVATMGTIADITERKKAEQALRESEERYRTIVETANEGVWSMDGEFRTTFVNDRMAEMLGYSPDEMIGRPVLGFMYEEDLANHGEQMFRRKQGEKGLYERRFKAKDGSEVWTRVSATALIGENGAFQGSFGLFTDITEVKEAVGALTESEEKYRRLFVNAPVGIVSIDTEGEILNVNPKMLEILGSPSAEGTKQINMLRFLPLREAGFAQAFERCIESGEPGVFEGQYTSKWGKESYGRMLVTPTTEKGGVVTGAEAVIEDITERKKAEERIQTSLKEKEVLLREIHHRVKNNLAVISSLLSLQSKYGGDESSRKILEESRTRINSMAIAHELLYRSENLTGINLREHIERLVNHLVGPIGPLSPVQVTYDIEDVPLGLDTMIPLGMIVTELISNCQKHAFPERREGEIRISLHRVGDDEFELTVNDNGVGMPRDLNLETPSSLGWELVNTFVEQLRGRIEVRRDAGTDVRLTFKETRKRPIERVDA